MLPEQQQWIEKRDRLIAARDWPGLVEHIRASVNLSKELLLSTDPTVQATLCNALSESVSKETYEAAVKGRADFREALRESRAYAVTLQSAALEAWYDWRDGMDEDATVASGHWGLTLERLLTHECTICEGSGDADGGGHCGTCVGFGRVPKTGHEIGQRNCPTCDGRDPALHPAVQSGGEVHLCEDPWHKPTATEIRAREAAERGHAVVPKWEFCAPVTTFEGDVLELVIRSDERALLRWPGGKLDRALSPWEDKLVRGVLAMARATQRPDPVLSQVSGNQKP